ncbi:hypothetical protein CP8484711_2201, partial [Chlamydia psittaci 84-8471/1]
ILGLLVSA